MSRPIRMEFPGALYHVTSRGNERRHIFSDSKDRVRFLEILSREVDERGWRCHAYCLMGNHYHLLVETPRANLSRGMRRLNAHYAQCFNRRHARIGHLVQGRYHAILVEKEAYLLELARYIVLNPVRARLAESPEDWRWSSYRATAGIDAAPPFLSTTELLDRFNQDSLSDARSRYAAFVREGASRDLRKEVRGGIWLGGAHFRRAMASRLRGHRATGVPHSQLDPERPTVDEVLGWVCESFEVTRPALLLRQRPDAYHAAVVLLRRAARLPIRDVAGLFGVSNARISAIQAAGARRGLPERLLRLMPGIPPVVPQEPRSTSKEV